MPSLERSEGTFKLGLCLGWKGQCICCVTRGREGGREGGRGGTPREGGLGRLGREGRGGREGGREGGRDGGRERGREGGMTVIHILI